MIRNRKFRFIPLLIFFAFIVSVFLTSCSSDNTVTNVPAASNGSASMMADMTGASDNNVLVIQSAKFLIEYVKLEKSHGSDDCDLKEGPFVVNINLSSVLSTFAVGVIPNGTYNEIHIKIHKHTPNEIVIDPDFGTTGVGYSGIITGTFNGMPFVFRTAITSSDEVDITPPLTVASGTAKMNVTLVVQPGLWFTKNGVILDPLDINNQAVIDDNIKASFKEAFEDNDKDGHPDH